MRIASWTIPSSREAAEPRASLCSGMPKRRIAGMPSSDDLGDGFAQPVERELVLARHRRDLAPQVLAVIDEQRIDQVVDGQAAFRGPDREAGDDRGGVGADAADNRRRAGRSSRNSPGVEGDDGRAEWSTDTIVARRASRGSVPSIDAARDDRSSKLMPAFVGGRGRRWNQPDLVAVGVEALDLQVFGRRASASKPIWIVMLHSDSSRAISFRLRLLR